MSSGSVVGIASAAIEIGQWTTNTVMSGSKDVVRGAFWLSHRALDAGDTVAAALQRAGEAAAEAEAPVGGAAFVNRDQDDVGLEEEEEEGAAWEGSVGPDTTRSGGGTGADSSVWTWMGRAVAMGVAMGRSSLHVGEAVSTGSLEFGRAIAGSSMALGQLAVGPVDSAVSEILRAVASVGLGLGDEEAAAMAAFASLIQRESSALRTLSKLQVCTALAAYVSLQSLCWSEVSRLDSVGAPAAAAAAAAAVGGAEMTTASRAQRDRWDRNVRFACSAYGKLGHVWLSSTISRPAAWPRSHADAVVEGAGLRDHGDILLTSWAAGMFRTAFFVAVDHEGAQVVLSLRGTMCLADLLTDLSCEHARFLGEDVHAGMLASALVVIEQAEDTIGKALRDNPGYRLTLVGHSLGAGVASLAMLVWLFRLGAFGDGAPAAAAAAGRRLDDGDVAKGRREAFEALLAGRTASNDEAEEDRGEGEERRGGGGSGGGSADARALASRFACRPHFPADVIDSLHCFAFAVPCTVSPPLSARLQPHITSVVVGDDVVPRLSLGSVLDIRDALVLLSDEAGLVQEILRAQVSRTMGAGLPDETTQLRLQSTWSTLHAGFRTEDRALIPPGCVWHISAPTAGQENGGGGGGGGGDGSRDAAAPEPNGDGYQTPVAGASTVWPSVQRVHSRCFGKILFSQSMLSHHMPSVYADQVRACVGSRE